jgi:hypothetical protein
MKLHPHAVARMLERGASEEEVTATIHQGERFAAKFGRQGFRRISHSAHCGEIADTI